MALVNSAFTVNVTPGAMPPTVHVSEYDIGRTYTVTINGQNGSAFNIPSGTTATVEGTLNGVIGFTTGATISGSNVSFTLTESMTARSGKAWCKIKLTLNDEPIQTCAFVLAVDRAGVEADTVIGADGFDTIIQNAVDNYLEEHPVPTVTVDPTLTISGAAADAKVTGDEIGDLRSAFNSIGYEIGGTLIQIETLADGRYWLSNGTNSWGTSPVYLVSKSVQLHSGDTLVYSAYGVSAASMMTEVSASGNEVTSGAHILFGDNSETPLTGTYKADRDMLVQFSFNKTKDYQFSLSSFKKTSFDYMLMMKTIGVIGDSLASGEIAYTEGGTDHYVDRYDGSWLSEICRTIGATPTHYSRGGMTAKAWLEDAGSYKSQLQTDGALNAYYLALGTNDISESYPIGTTADTAGTDSFVGYMRSIIEYVHGIAPYAPIFLVSTYGTSVNHVTYSNMIASIAGLYDYCYFVDYKNNADIFTSTGGVWSNLGHFTSVGYVRVADKIKLLTNDLIKTNAEDFKFYTLNN